MLCSAALAVRDLLHELDLPSWVKTSGSKGFHIVVPIEPDLPFDEVAAFASSVAAILVQRHSSTLTLEFSKAERGGRIYVDVGRNGYSATFAAAYSVRPKPGAPVSAPCRWDEIENRLGLFCRARQRSAADRLSAAQSCRGSRGICPNDLGREIRGHRHPAHCHADLQPR